jgi:hypothetical protein
VKLLAIEAGQTSKALLIVTGRRLRTEGVPRAIHAAHLLKLSQLRLLENVKNNKLAKVPKILFMIFLQKNNHTGTTTSKLSPENILEKDSTLDVSDRLANEIKDKGITCHIVRDRINSI